MTETTEWSVGSVNGDRPVAAPRGARALVRATGGKHPPTRRGHLDDMEQLVAGLRSDCAGVVRLEYHGWVGFGAKATGDFDRVEFPVLVRKFHRDHPPDGCMYDFTTIRLG